MNKASKHVVPDACRGWSVRNSGAARVSRKFNTQAYLFMIEGNFVSFAPGFRDGNLKEPEDQRAAAVINDYLSALKGHGK